MTIQIYQNELAVEGLADKILANSSVAFDAQLFREAEIENKALAAAIKSLSIASENDKDLYSTKSILVSTNWNKNDDVFSPAQVWSARHTPSHKPTNIEHDEHQLVGHITTTWAITDDGKIIADNTPIDELPNLFHVVNGAVIYTVWQDDELQKRTAKLIEEIQSGNKFVSMECLFADFDYAVTDGSLYKVISRNEGTSWLTKHLRCYGGTGQFDGKRVGRLLKNITFCGKGYVNQPANPNSIIFNSAAHVMFNFVKASHIDNLENKETTQFTNSGVLSNSNENLKGDNMADVNDKEKLEAEVKDLREKLEAANKTIAEANTVQLTAKVEKMEAEIAELKQTVEAKDGEISTKSAQLDEVIAKVASLEETKTKLEKEIQDVRAAELVAKRVAKLVDGGVVKEVAEQKVAIFAGLNDEQFDAVANEIIEAVKAKCADDKEKEDKEKAAKKMEDEEDDEDEADANLNIKVEPESQPDLSSSASQSDKDERAEIRKEIASLLSKKIKKAE